MKPSEKPLALRLADQLDGRPDFTGIAWEVAAELRRLHARVQELEASPAPATWSVVGGRNGLPPKAHRDNRMPNEVAPDHAPHAVWMVQNRVVATLHATRESAEAFAARHSAAAGLTIHRVDVIVAAPAPVAPMKKTCSTCLHVAKADDCNPCRACVRSNSFSKWEPSAPAPVAQQPLTHMQAVLLWGHRSDGPSTAEIVSFASAVERTCAEAWGIKLAQEGGAA